MPKRPCTAPNGPDKSALGHAESFFVLRSAPGIASKWDAMPYKVIFFDKNRIERKAAGRLRLPEARLRRLEAAPLGGHSAARVDPLTRLRASGSMRFGLAWLF